MVPWDEGAMPMCWLCAHAVTHHEAELYAPLEQCSCRRDEIYPADVLSRRHLMGIASPDVVEVAEPAAVPSVEALPRKDMRDFRQRAQGEARAARAKSLAATTEPVFAFVGARRKT